VPNRIVRMFALLMLGIGAPVLAHHSFAMFDQTKQVTLKGTVREFQWTNPHAFIHVQVPAADGSSEIWQVELNSPNNLKRQGWKSGTLKTGDNVTVVLNPLKDGSKGGLFVTITLPDGTVLGDATRARGGSPINVPVPEAQRRESREAPAARRGETH
jgi:hypothetical protein